MADNLRIFGVTYSSATGIKATDDGDVVRSFIRPQGTLSVSENGLVDVTQYANVDVDVAGGGGGTDFIVTLSYDSQSDMWLPDCTYAELYSAYSGGKTIAWMCDSGDTAVGVFNASDNSFTYSVFVYFGDSSEEGTETLIYTIDANGVTFDGSDGKTYYTDNATALPADVANGKIFYNANGRQTGTASGGSAVIQSLSVTQNGTYTAPTGVDGYSPVTVNVSGGGGASNVVTGTFKGTTTNAAMDVTLNYTGTGYPVALMIYPTEGAYNSGTGSFYSLLQRYAIGTYYSIKGSIDLTPTYPTSSSTSAANQSIYLYRYKSSATVATSGSNSGNTVYNYMNLDATSSQNSPVRIRSNTKMSVFIAGTSYGFAANIEYTYRVIYSS